MHIGLDSPRDLKPCIAALFDRCKVSRADCRQYRGARCRAFLNVHRHDLRLVYIRLHLEPQLALRAAAVCADFGHGVTHFPAYLDGVAHGKGYALHHASGDLVYAVAV